MAKEPMSGKRGAADVGSEGGDKTHSRRRKAAVTSMLGIVARKAHARSRERKAMAHGRHPIDVHQAGGDIVPEVGKWGTPVRGAAAAKNSDGVQHGR